MAINNRVRGIRQSLPSNVLIGRGVGKGGPAQAIPLSIIAQQLVVSGAIPLPGAGGGLTVNVTSISGGAANKLLYDNGGTLEEATVGTGLSLSAGTLSATGGSSGAFAPLVTGETPGPIPIANAAGEFIMVPLF